MSRIARVIIPGIPHHVTQRGNRRQRTFFSDANYESYLNLLAATAKAFNFDIWSYCLMPNHVHLLAVPQREGSLREGIGQTHNSYTRMVNRENGWTGCLWQGRFFSCPIDPIRAAIVARYIELNPVRAGLCKHPREYRWSSANAACSSNNSSQNAFSPLVSPIGSWEEFLCHDLKDNNIDPIDLWRCSQSGRPFGSEHFVKDMESTTGRLLAPMRRGPKTESSGRVHK